MYCIFKIGGGFDKFKPADVSVQLLLSVEHKLLRYEERFEGFLNIVQPAGAAENLEIDKFGEEFLYYLIEKRVV